MSWARVAIIAALSRVTETAVAAGASVTFPFDDARYLQAGEKEGGLVHRTDANANGELPILVYLHGTNEKGPLHRGLGSPGFDLRKTPNLGAMLIAGPSMTRDAWTGSRLWPDFDLTRFVDAVDAALPDGVSVDRARVILAGHSGAGCNLKGGLLSPLGMTPRAILAIDTCLDGDFGRALGEAADRAPVHVFWQQSWARDVPAFETAFAEALQLGRGTVTRMDVPGPNPHEDIVSLVLEQTLPGLLAD
jgi:hypothetical protein